MYCDKTVLLQDSSAVRDSGEESQQLSLDLGSRSQSPMSLVVQLNEESECSLQSLPPGEHGPTNFSMMVGPPGEYRPTKFSMSGLVRGNITAAEYLEDDSRCSEYSERLNDETDLLMEVESGSTMSEAVSVKDSTTSLHPDIIKSTSTGSQKSSGRTEDRNKSRIRKRLMVETPTVENEDGFVTNTTTSVFCLHQESQTVLDKWAVLGKMGKIHLLVHCTPYE